MGFHRRCFDEKRLRGKMEVLDYRMSFMVNGRPRGLFNTSRGIRQGDPLSPFLFVLVADALNKLVLRARCKGLVEGFKIGKERVGLTHLQFANETIFFLSRDSEKFENLIGILRILA